MDEALAVLLDPEDEEPPGLPTVAQLEAERGKWKVLRPENVDLFVLWHSMSGMGGESLYNLWRLSREEGSAAMLVDFSTLSRRLARLKQREEFRKK